MASRRATRRPSAEQSDRIVRGEGKSDDAVRHVPRKAFGRLRLHASRRLTVVWTDADFDTLSWHDCHIWGIDLRAGNADDDDWTSDLALDIDFLVEWLRESDESFRFRVAPATLVFHGVTDLSINVAWQPTGFQVALHPVSIAHIERTAIENQKVFLDRPYYRFRIASSWPAGGEIVFGAVGFTQTLRAEPIVSADQRLTLRTRHRTPGSTV